MPVDDDDSVAVSIDVPELSLIASSNSVEVSDDVTVLSFVKSPIENKNSISKSL